jgi:hypothetical protein
VTRPSLAWEPEERPEFLDLVEFLVKEEVGIDREELGVKREIIKRV